MMWSSQSVTWNPHNPRTTSIGFMGRTGLLASSAHPRIYAATPVYLPYFPYFLETNMDTLENCRGPAVAKLIDTRRLLHNRPAFSHRLIALSAAAWFEPDSS